jgi:DNA ligase-associated metallophosphoesterase
MTPGSHRLVWCGQELWLLPERAVFWPGENCLLVADAHFGKSALLREEGLALPDGTTASDFLRLEKLVAFTGVREVLFLGDTLHAPAVRKTGLPEKLRWFVSKLPARCVALPGNHDVRALPLLEETGFEVASPTLPRGPFLLKHEPPSPGSQTPKPILCGHLHPGFAPPRSRGPRWRAPCFWLSGEALHLPAFGSFTGLAMVAARPGDSVFLLAEGTVVAWQIPPRQTKPGKIPGA